MDIKAKYKKLKHYIQKLLRQLYQQYIKDFVIPKITDNTRAMYNIMKRFWNYIKHDRKLITDPILNANVMNHQFQSVFSSAENYPLDEFDKRWNMPPGSNSMK